MHLALEPAVGEFQLLEIGFAQFAGAREDEAGDRQSDHSDASHDEEERKVMVTFGQCHSHLVPAQTNDDAEPSHQSHAPNSFISGGASKFFSARSS